MVDFAVVAAAALARVEELLPRWLPNGKRRGHEWVCGSLDGDPGDSCSTNLTTGKGADFATGQAWGDLVSLYAQINGKAQLEALHELAEHLGIKNGRDHSQPIQGTVEQRAEPAPTDVPLPGAHPRHGAASATYRYFDAGDRLVFLVCRYDLPAGKQFCPYTWRGGRWVAKAYPSPRPLYGLKALLAEPSMPVMVVEGEKARDAAAALLQAYIVVTWAGGAQAAKTADWTPLAGRDVVLWPDADDPGRAAMANLATVLASTARRVRVIDTEDQPTGWDLADATAEGWTASRIAEWAKPRVREIPKSNVIAIRTGKPPDRKPPIATVSAERPESAVASWQSLELECNQGGIPLAFEANVVAVLGNHPVTRGKIWFDSFREEVWHSLSGAPRAWTDQDSRDWMYWMQKSLRLGKFTKRLVDEGVLIYAGMNRRNSVHEWVESQPWDGIPRIDEWLSDYFGCPRDAHHRAAARNWPIGMIARAYNPGCQLDHMLIIEGKAGRGKTSAMLALASPWAHTLTQRFGSKEFTEAIQSNWLVELADLAALANPAHSKMLGDITNRDDRYRTPWDRLASDHPRRCVFVGTTEKHNDYLADTYGIRRFWSVRCGDDVNIEALKAVRQQIFAEALVQFRAGEPYHIMPEQTREEQLDRVEHDEYTGRIAEYLDGKTEITALEIFEAVFVKRDEYGRMLGRTIMEGKDTHRIAKCLRQLEWFNVQAKRNRRKVNLWQPVPARD